MAYKEYKREDNVLILGNGLLGTELHKQQPDWDIISRKENGFDITKPENYDDYFLEHHGRMMFYPKYKTIINCIANTDVYSEEKDEHWNVNYKGVADLVDYCNKWDIKLVHISTDYIYHNSKPLTTELDIPIHGDNWYSYTKLLADAYIELKSKNYLICRGTHKPTPFPYPQAWWDQYGNFDYVNVIAEKIIKLVELNADGLYNVGTTHKSIFELALQTKPDVEPISRLKDAPGNVLMNVDKLNRKLKFG